VKRQIFVLHGVAGSIVRGGQLRVLTCTVNVEGGWRAWVGLIQCFAPSVWSF